jgi:fluoride exporter
VPDVSPIDPDVDLHVPAQRQELRRHAVRVLGVVALGGAAGALARYGVSLLLPTEPGRFPLGTFGINVAGCFLIGVLMVLVTEAFRAHPLVRPALGTGVLGGFTTFSTYANEVHGLLRPGEVLLAFGYLFASLACGLVAAALGIRLTRIATGRRVAG